MAKGILGTKLGMTQVFNDAGKLVPVTVVQCDPNVVLQKKTVETDGYDAVKVGFKDKREALVSKPLKGQFAKANATPKRYIKEIAGKELSNFEVGQEIKVNIFNEGEAVDVTGTSKGKGFQGVIKRHNQSRGPMSHGSHYHRLPGSMGSIDPNHVRPGKNLPGHMGFETVTIQNLEIVKVDVQGNLLLVKGNVPGPRKGLVVIKNAIKHDKELEPLNPDDYVVVEEAPVEETPEVEAAPEVEAPVEEAPVEETPEVEAPVEEAPVEETPEVEAAPEVEAPVEVAPAEAAPAEAAPAEEAPVEEPSVEVAPAEEVPVEEVPAEEEPSSESEAQEAPEESDEEKK